MRQRTTTLCGQGLDGVLHVCAFVESREQQYELLLPFLQEGRSHGERLLSVLPSERHDTHIAWMRQHDLPNHALLDGLQPFVPRRMLDTLEHQLAQTHRDGFGGLRGFVEMDGAIHSRELAAYELRVNDVVRRYHDVLVCIYDAHACSARMRADLMAAHPQVIIDGRLHSNAYWPR